MPDPGQRVLVVDDDDTIRGFLAELLADEGYRVDTAANGQEALAALQSGRPDLILLDLMMPVMDGLTFRARQREMDGASEVPVVVMSANLAAVKQAQDMQVAATLTKPFDLASLLAVIHRVL
ncbi:MAG: response regulator [Chloroflexota bacterium]